MEVLGRIAVVILEEIFVGNFQSIAHGTATHLEKVILSIKFHVHDRIYDNNKGKLSTIWNGLITVPNCMQIETRCSRTVSTFLDRDCSKSKFGTPRWK